MSAATAPVLAKAERRIVVVRLADVSFTIAWFSAIFALLLLAFPVWFPHQIVLAWRSGYLAPFMAAFVLIVDGVLYFRIAHLHSARPGILHSVWLGSMPVLVSVINSLVQQSAISEILSRDLPNLDARITEVVLAHTYLGIMSAIFVPFLLIRLTHSNHKRN